MPFLRVSTSGLHTLEETDFLDSELKSEILHSHWPIVSPESGIVDCV
jgi:hypothetical protein